MTADLLAEHRRQHPEPQCPHAETYQAVARKYGLQPSTAEELALNASCDRRGGR